MNQLPVSWSSEDRLFARAQAGDATAWHILFNTCYPKIKRSVRRKLHGPMRAVFDASDFASDVMKSLVSKRERFDFANMDSLMAFLNKCVEQKLIDEQRRQHTLKRNIQGQCSLDQFESESGELAKTSDPSPSQVAQADETREQLLAQLSDEERRVVELRLADHSTAEIAKETSWHPRKVQRFFQALHESWFWRSGGGDKR